MKRNWKWIKNELEKPDRFLQHIWNKHGKKVYKFRPDEGKDDFFQEAKIILLKLAKKYDKSRGVKFSTYAYSWLKGYIKGEWDDFDLKSKSLDASDQRAQNPNTGGGASSIGQLRAGLQRNGELSTRDGKNQATVVNIARRKAWARLDQRERKVTALTFVGENQKTIAGELGVSRSRVSQIRNDIKEIMKNQINTVKAEK